MRNNIIYLDNAATTFPKPPSVISSVADCLKNYCGNPSRGSNPLAMKSSQAVFETRKLLANMFGCRTENCVFTYNTTYALNIAIKGVMGNGGHILISNMEHNATLRPIAKMQKDGKIEYNTFDAYMKTDEEIISDIDRKKRQDTKAVCCLHTSNICSYTLPIAKIGKYCHENGLIFICDAAQSAGHTRIDMKEFNIDILCIPFHKGIYGTQGGGAMLIGENVYIQTLVEGGNGVNSLEFFMGDDVPEKFEAGTINTPAIVGLGEGLKYLRRKGFDYIASHEEHLFDEAISALSRVKNVTFYDLHRGSTGLFGVCGRSSDEVGEILGEHGICVRTGFHCSPLAHKALHTPSDGAVRISFGLFNTPSQINRLAEVVEDIATGKLHT